MKSFSRVAIACLAAFLICTFISCSHSTSSDDDSGAKTSTRTYTSVSGGTYKYSGNGSSFVFTFNSNKSVSGKVNGTDLSTLNLKWKESGKEITVYEDYGTTQVTVYFFTANSSFTTLSYMGGLTLTRQ